MVFSRSRLAARLQLVFVEALPITHLLGSEEFERGSRSLTDIDSAVQSDG